MSLLHLLLISLAFQILLFLVAYFFQSDKLTDAGYALGFVLLSFLAFLFGEKSAGHLVLLLVVTLWALRLGSYLLIRILKTKKDKRFDKIRPSFLKFFSFWVLQALSVFIVLLPSFFAFEFVFNFTSISALGLALWAFGLLFEAIADMQKFGFIQNPANKGKWIASGLWRYSRHPNYFGEILCWVGIYFFVLSSLSGWQILFGVLSPLYIASLIIFVSGIPKLEEYADKKWGNDPNYRKYKKQTPVLVPKFSYIFKKLA